MDLEIIMLSEVSQTMRHWHQMLSMTCGIWKKDTMNFFAEQMLTHRLWKTYGFQRRQFGGWGDALGVWDGNPIKLDYNDHCTTINVVNSLSNNKKRNTWHIKLQVITLHSRSLKYFRARNKWIEIPHSGSPCSGGQDCSLYQCTQPRSGWNLGYTLFPNLCIHVLPLPTGSAFISFSHRCYLGWGRLGFPSTVNSTVNFLLNWPNLLYCLSQCHFIPYPNHWNSLLIALHTYKII